MGLGPGLPSADTLPSAVTALPWFAHLGDPFPDDPAVVALQDWAGVPATDDERTLELALDQQARFDLLRDERAEAAFREWHDRVILATATVDGLHTDGDAWDPRTQCRYDAAFTVGLVAMTLVSDPSGRSAPDGLADLWGWFAAGHWPCGYADLAYPRRLLVL